MPTPFPGMDPYLERRQRWNAIHTRLIVAIADALSPLIRPQYRVDIELRTYIALLTGDSPAGVPDVLVMSSPGESRQSTQSTTLANLMPEFVEIPMPEEIRERYLVVRAVSTETVITVIEVLSLANKLTSEGRNEYLRKRMSVLSSQTNLVEIDLLRAGDSLPPFGDDDSDYRLLVSPYAERPTGHVYRFSVRDPIPDLPIPLRPDDDSPILPLNQLLHELYDRGGYDLAIDYNQPPEPPLREADVDWAQQIMRQFHA